MTVFLGNTGRVMLTRKSAAQKFITLVNAADISGINNRFSVDFAHEQIITGDSLEVRTTGGEDLSWINDPSADDSFTRYVHVDEAGGIRFYNTFSEAIRGEAATAIDLRDPPTPQEVSVKIVNGDDARCLAEVSSYQITTSRETIDTTHLGAHYRKQYEAGLIQGQGSIDCLWRHPGLSICDEGISDSTEFVSYLARLCIRLVHGAAFHGFFYIYYGGNDRSLWYESESCIVTNVAITITPTQLVRTTIDFVTNGPITLREGYAPSYLELEQSDFDVELEQGGNIELENPD